MKIWKEPFGTTQNGEIVSKYFLKNSNGTQAVLTDFGVTLLSLNYAGKDVVLGYDSTIAPEAYKMIVTRKHIHIYASDLSGFLYAFQTLRQALPDSIGNASHSDGQVWAVPVMTVYDAPRYMHRCL